MSGKTVSHNVAGIVVSHNVVSDNFIAGIVLHSNAPGDMLMKNAATDNTVAGNGAEGEVGAFQTTGMVGAGVVTPVTDNTITGNHVCDETLGIYVTGTPASHISGNILDTPASVPPSLEIVGQGGNVAAGEPVVYTVENPTAPTGLPYQYWADSAAGWRMVQNYSPDNVYAMRDVAAGSYQVVAYSLTPAALKARAWHDAASASHIINVGSSVSLAVMGAMSGMTANSMTVQAAAKNLLHPVYQFWWQGPNGQWTASGNYSTDNMMDILPPTVAPAQAGTYAVVAYAKDANAPESAAYEVFSQPLSIKVSPRVDFVLTPASAAINPGGSAVLTLSQEYSTGAMAPGRSLDNLDSTFTIAGANGQPASGFTISGFGGGIEAMLDGTYTFLGAPTRAVGTVNVTAGSSVAPGTYTVRASDPDHMDATSAPVDIVVR